jgi:hypothetical protein
VDWYGQRKQVVRDVRDRAKTLSISHYDYSESRLVIQIYHVCLCPHTGPSHISDITLFHSSIDVPRFCTHADYLRQTRLISAAVVVARDLGTLDEVGAAATTVLIISIRVRRGKKGELTSGVW